MLNRESQAVARAVLGELAVGLVAGGDGQRSLSRLRFDYLVCGTGGDPDLGSLVFPLARLLEDVDVQRASDGEAASYCVDGAGDVAQPSDGLRRAAQLVGTLEVIRRLGSVVTGTRRAA